MTEQDFIWTTKPYFRGDGAVILERVPIEGLPPLDWYKYTTDVEVVVSQIDTPKGVRREVARAEIPIPGSTPQEAFGNLAGAVEKAISGLREEARKESKRPKAYGAGAMPKELNHNGRRFKIG